MKILIIKGSPHEGGATSILIEEFKKGAEEAGHEIFVFDASHATISPCLACEYCHGKGNGECYINDDMKQLKKMIFQSEVIVLATPLYFFNMASQIKIVIDRMYAFIGNLKGKAAVLLVAANNPNTHIMDIIVENYLSITSFMQMRNAGMILAIACGTPELTLKTKYPALAYKLGKEIR